MTYLPAFPEPPMSDELASLLRRLCDEADVPFDATLGARRAERLAACLIDELRLRVLPPHTD
jgi:hypothetical protein